VFDGISIAGVLRGQALEREAIFTYFPHSPKVPDHLPPAVAVHSGDWKLIRVFHEGENGSHACQLYNLKSDVGETNDLARSQPSRVKQLDVLIETFLADTKAVVPKPNPAYNSAARTEDASTATADPLEGWKARQCEASVKDGVITVTGKGAAPFLGLAAGKMGGATAVKFRVLSATGGAGKVEWLPTPQAADKANSVPFQLAGGEWRELSVELPAVGALGIVRLYLPAEKDAVQIDWIELKPAQGKARRWDF
jgi:hypothetical protein